MSGLSFLRSFTYNTVAPKIQVVADELNLKQPNMVLISADDGTMATSEVSVAELGYLNFVNNNVQTQINTGTASMINTSNELITRIQNVSSDIVSDILGTSNNVIQYLNVDSMPNGVNGKYIEDGFYYGDLNIAGNLTVTNYSVNGDVQSFVSPTISNISEIASDSLNGPVLKIHEKAQNNIIELGHGAEKKVTMLYDGKLGIGTATPAKTVDVVGDVRASGTINGVTPTRIGYLSGVTDNIQTQIDNYAAISVSSQPSIGSLSLSTSSNMANNIINMSNNTIGDLSTSSSDMSNYIVGVTDQKQDVINFSKTFIQDPVDNSISVKSTIWDVNADNISYEANGKVVNVYSDKIMIDSQQAVLVSDVNSKQDIITGSATSIMTELLTPNKMVVTDANSKVASHTVAPTDLVHLAGVTSSVQGQIDGIQTKITDTTNDLTEYGNTEYTNITAYLTSITSNELAKTTGKQDAITTVEGSLLKQGNVISYTLSGNEVTNIAQEQSYWTKAVSSDNFISYSNVQIYVDNISTKITQVFQEPHIVDSGIVQDNTSFVNVGDNQYIYSFTNSSNDEHSITFPQDTFVDVLIVGGGGSGGHGDEGVGGGGGGGSVYVASNMFVPANTKFPIVVGKGGIAAFGENGGESSAFGITAVGGGAGGNSDAINGMTLGTGGGGGINLYTCNVGLGGLVTGKTGADGAILNVGDGAYAEFPRENMDADTFTYTDGIVVECKASTVYNSDVSYSPHTLFNGVFDSQSTWLSGIDSGTGETYDASGNALVTYKSEYPGEWVMVDLGEDVIVKQTKLYPLTAQLTRQPKEFNIYGTNDSTAFSSGSVNDNQWNLLYNGVNPNATVSDVVEPVTYDLSNNVIPYRFYAMVINKIYTNGLFAQFAEWELLGHKVGNYGGGGGGAGGNAVLVPSSSYPVGGAGFVTSDIVVGEFGTGGSGGSTNYSGYGGGHGTNIGAYDNANGGNGIANTGGGGGGAKTGGVGGDGGSGLVVVKWYADDKITFTNIVTQDDLANKQDILTFGQGLSYDAPTNTLALTDTPLWKDGYDGGSHISYGNVKVYDNKIKIGNKLTSEAKNFYNDTTDMTVWYKFDGNLTDSSDNGKNLILENQIASPYSNNIGLELGTSTIATYTSSSLANNIVQHENGKITFTASFRMKGGAKTAAGVYTTLFQANFGNSSFKLYISPNSTKLQPVYFSGTWNSTSYYIEGSDIPNLFDNTLKNIIVTADDVSVKIYVNSVQYLTFSTTALSISAANETFTIGPINSSGLIMSDFRIYNRVLTSDEIQTLYNGEYIVSKNFLKDTSDMYVWYKFNGDLNDDGGYSRDATGYNSPTFDNVIKKEGTHAISFAGGAAGTDSQYLTVPSTDFSLWGGFTVSCWVMFEDDASYARIFDFTDSTMTNRIILSRNITTNKILLSIYNSGWNQSYTENDVIVNNTWMHISWVISKTSEWKLYVNGILQLLNISNSLFPVSTTYVNCYIAKSSGSDGYFKGKMDDFRIYKRALSEGEAKALYDMEIPTYSIGELYVNTIKAKEITALGVAPSLQIGNHVSIAKDAQQTGILKGSYIQSPTMTGTYTNSSFYSQEDNEMYEYAQFTTGTGFITFPQDTVCDILLVGGGGSGSIGKGGGSSGGMLYATNQPIPSGTYHITVGTGGTNGNGGDSSAFGATAKGGLQATDATGATNNGDNVLGEIVTWDENKVALAGGTPFEGEVNIIDTPRKYPPSGLTGGTIDLTDKTITQTPTGTPSYGGGDYTVYWSTNFHDTSETYAGHKVFNGSTTDTGWHTGVEAAYNGTDNKYNLTTYSIKGTYYGEWVKLKLPVAIYISSIKCYIRGDGSGLSANQMVEDFKIYGSNDDGITWVEIISKTGVSGTYQSVEADIVSVDGILANTTAYNFYGMVVNKTVGYGNGYVCIGELEFWGNETTTTPSGGGGVGSAGGSPTSLEDTPNGGDGLPVSIRTPNEIFAGGGGANGGARVPETGYTIGYGGNSTATTVEDGGDGIAIVRWKKPDNNISSISGNNIRILTKEAISAFTQPTVVNASQIIKHPTEEAYYTTFTDTTIPGSITFPQDTVCDILIVGGGGSGSIGKGGGSSGGMLYSTNQPIPYGTYSITVGAGGVNGNGGDSSAFGATAKGGLQATDATGATNNGDNVLGEIVTWDENKVALAEGTLLSGGGAAISITTPLIEFPRENFGNTTNSKTYTSDPVGTIAQVKASSVLDVANWNISKAFNGDRTTNGEYISASGRYDASTFLAKNTFRTGYAGDYIMIDLGESMYLASFKLYFNSNQNHRKAVSFRLYASDTAAVYSEAQGATTGTNNPNWTQIYEETDNTSYTTGTEFTIATVPSTSSRYYMLIVNRINSDTVGYLSIGELELYGNTTKTTTPSGGGGVGSAGGSPISSTDTPNGGEGLPVSIRTPNEIFAGGGGANGGARVPETGYTIGYGGNSTTTTAEDGGSGIVIIKWYPKKKAVYTSKEYCMRTKRNIWMDSANVIWTSDIRIKKDVEDINDDSALDQVLRLQPKTYKYKNTLERGNKKVYGFISQQVEDVIPEATTKTTNFIPNIYEHCEYSNTILNNIPHSTITLPTDYDIATLSVAMNSSNISTRVRVINENSESSELDFVLTSNVSGYGLMTEDITDFTNNSSNVFVYGTEVEDLTTIDKSYLYTLNVCATQVLSRKIDTLEASNSAMMSRIEQLESELDTLQSSFQ